MTRTAIPALVQTACLHCGQAFRPSAGSAFCCRGCEAVYSVIHGANLDKFYSLRPAKILPLIHYFQRQRPLDWVEGLEGFKTGDLTLGIEGIQCAACVWLLQQMARRGGVARVSVDPALGKLELKFIPGGFDALAFLGSVQRLGYRLGEYRGAPASESSSLLWRMGVCLALAMNNMSISVAIYLGLNREFPLLFTLFGKLSFLFALISVVTGGSYFFDRAIRALKARVLHFDLPIALGILAAFAGSAYLFAQGRYQDAYFDTVTLFTALMLAGRYLQERLIQKNRNQLLFEGELKDVTVTRVGEGLSQIRLSNIQSGDVLLIQPGSFNPTEAELISPESVECSLAWISGESRPVVYRRGATVPAGALPLSSSAMKVRALKGYGNALLAQLAGAPRDYEPLPLIWQWVTRWYVALVLGFALFGLGLWSFIDPARAPTVFISILVVTCPCSLGIGIPIARALANKALLVRGVFARDGALLDKWLAVRKVFLDKTGTLTLSALSVDNPEAFDSLSAEELEALFNAAAHSRHPASAAIFQHLSARALKAREMEVVEIPGSGLEIRCGGRDYFLGQREKPPACDDGAYEVNFWSGPALLARVALRERLLDSAEAVVGRLKAAGIRVALLSGDKRQRVAAMAETLGLAAEDAHAGLKPADKARIVAEAGRGDTLMLGDGLNDSLAFEKAHLCGAALGERANLAHRADFFFVTGSLEWLADCFGIASRLKGVLTANLYFAALYNGIVVALALMGLMKPLFCAVLMPASSLVILAFTMARMKGYLK